MDFWTIFWGIFGRPNFGAIDSYERTKVTAHEKIQGWTHLWTHITGPNSFRKSSHNGWEIWTYFMYSFFMHITPVATQVFAQNIPSLNPFTKMWLCRCSVSLIFALTSATRLSPLRHIHHRLVGGLPYILCTFLHRYPCRLSSGFEQISTLTKSSVFLLSDVQTTYFWPFKITHGR